MNYNVKYLHHLFIPKLDLIDTGSDSGAESGSGGPPSLDSDGDLRVATETHQPDVDSDSSMDMGPDLLRGQYLVFHFHLNSSSLALFLDQTFVWPIR